MSIDEKSAVFKAVLEEALKRMQETATATVSSAYEVVRSSGEVIVRRPDKADEKVTPPLKKTGTG